VADLRAIVSSPASLPDTQGADARRERVDATDFAQQLAHRLGQPLAQSLEGDLRRTATAPTVRSPGAVPVREVAPMATHMSANEARAALADGWQAVFGERPNADTLDILTAQWALETGHGRSMMNYNFGGIKGAGPSGLTVAYRTREGYGENERVIVDRFRAYASPSEGATDYVGLLKRRYGAALDCARAGDTRGFVHALASRGYFTASEATYATAIERITQSLRGGALDHAGGARSAEPRRAVASAPSMASPGDALVYAELREELARESVAVMHRADVSLSRMAGHDDDEWRRR
jgi:hypothetical protein